MPVKILLADKSITIQKVVEMLFSGRGYEVTCASDGEAALNEAARVMPDVVLADVGLPQIDGYGLAARLKQTPASTHTPVILMMSRDDVYDSAKGAEAGIADNITKPFESQDLISKVKKALSAAPPSPAGPPKEPAVPRPAAPELRPAALDRPATAPSDIFDIIQEAPAPSELLQEKAAAQAGDDMVFEVEPEVEEVEEPQAPESARALPVGDQAMAEMRAGLGLGHAPEEDQPESVPFEAFERAMDTAPRPVPAASPPRTPAATAEVLSALPASELRKLAEEIVAKMAREVFAKMPPPPLPKVTDDTVRMGIEVAVSKIAREIGREVIERVAWEVIPPLAEQLIKEEIERLKAKQ